MEDSGKNNGFFNTDVFIIHEYKYNVWLKNMVTVAYCKCSEQIETLFLYFNKDILMILSEPCLTSFIGHTKMTATCLMKILVQKKMLACQILNSHFHLIVSANYCQCNYY